MNSINSYIGRDRITLVSSGSDTLRLSNENIEYKFNFEPAEVVDIILDEKHKDYPTKKDKTFIGRARVRRIFTDENKEIELLPLAKPLQSNIKDYPLIGEFVLTFLSMGSTGTQSEELYYIHRLNFFNEINNNAFKDLTKPIDSKAESDDKLGKNFEPDKDIKGLQPFEGDYILEGRFGQSIRFTCGKKEGKVYPEYKKFGKPLLIITNGTEKKIKEDFRVEDINEDNASIYLTSDHEIKVDLPCDKKESFEGDYPKNFDGKQIIFNSDRILFISRKKEFLANAKKHIGFQTDGSFLVDSKKKTVINSPEIYLGLDAEEPLMLGNKTIKFLEKLIDTLLSTQYYYGCINPTPLMNLKKELDQLISKKNFTV